MQEHEKKATRTAVDTTLAVGGVALAAATGGVLSIALASLSAFKLFALSEGADVVRKEYLEAVWTQVLCLGARVSKLEAESEMSNELIDDIEIRVNTAQATADVAISSVVEEIERRGAPCTELLSVLECGYRAWRTSSDPEKRNYVLNGLRSSFYCREFDLGIRRTLLNILEGIETFEIHHLEAIAGARPDCKDVHYTNHRIKSSGRHHAVSGEGVESLFEFSRARLVNFGLIARQTSSAQALDVRHTISYIPLTGLGHQLLRFISPEEEH